MVSVRTAGLLLVVASVFAAAPQVEASLVEVFVVAAPGGWVSTYATPVVVVEVGGDLTFVNGDAMRHDVVAFGSYGPDDKSWCGLFHPGHCPLFWSAAVGLGETTPVEGTANLEQGAIYEFYCTLHEGMRGKLVAVPPST